MINPLLGRQLSTLYQRSSLALLVQLVATLLVAAMLFNKLPRISLAAWAIGMIAILGLQLIMARVFLAKSIVSRPNLWQGVAAVISLVGGLLWGLLALIHPEVPSMMQAGLVVATAAAAATVLWSTASSAFAFPAFMLGLLAPWGLMMVRGPVPPSTVALAFAGISVVYLGLFLLINRQAMELVRLQNHAARTTRPVPSTAVATAKPLAVSSVHASTPLSTVTLAERGARPYSGLKRRASDYRPSPNPPEEPSNASSFGQIKINDIANAEPLEPSACTILVVEDNLDNQLVALHLLQKRGYRVVIANNGREALAAVERQRFELILMDVQMPEMGGLEATAAIRLKERQGAKRIPIIALTANPVSESREICLAAGMDDYLNKPISRTRLFAALDAQLKKKPRPAV
jgi:CheY-like chemotaxis protein